MDVGVGQLGPQIDLFPGGGGLSPQLAMAPSGRAFAAWQSDLNFESTVYGRWVERDGTLGPLLTLQAPEPGKINPVEVHVAVDPAGVATVVWRNDTGGNANIGLRRVQPDSSVGPVVPKLGEGTGIQVADLPNGSTVVAWRSSGTEINTVTSDLTVGTPALISSNNKTANPTSESTRRETAWWPGARATPHPSPSAVSGSTHPERRSVGRS